MPMFNKTVSSEVDRFLDILNTQGNIIFEGNRESVRYLTELAKDLIVTEEEREYGKTRIWHLPDTPVTKGPRIVIMPSGHMVFYGAHGLRILGADPSGVLLHECEWGPNEKGSMRMIYARVQLDFMGWGGIKPGVVHESRHEFPPNQPPIEDVDILRQMIAKAWDVPLDDVRYFYPDESFTRDDKGFAIRRSLDEVYLLPNKTFDGAIFVSNMDPIPWARIDLLNVVELYKSALHCVGGAAFDLIWGLCDDQRLAEGPIPLHYRGLPTYPVAQAYGLFCAFFRPETPNGENPYEVFMDIDRAYQINWWVRHDPPWRCFDLKHRICITVQEGAVSKVTLIDDPIGMPFSGMKKFTATPHPYCGRRVEAIGGVIRLWDEDHVTDIPIDPSWGITKETPQKKLPRFPFGWRAFFEGDSPKIDPFIAWITGPEPIFPKDGLGEELGEEPTQLFVLEEIYACLNQIFDLPLRMVRTRNILIHNFEVVCPGFIDPSEQGSPESTILYDHPHWNAIRLALEGDNDIIPVQHSFPDDEKIHYSILYTRPRWAQKNAQILWDRAARQGRLEAVRYVKFLPEETYKGSAYQKKYDFLYYWTPFDKYNDPGACEKIVKDLANALELRGLGIVVGPQSLSSIFPSKGLRIIARGGSDKLTRLPVVADFLRAHPDIRINPALRVMVVERA